MLFVDCGLQSKRVPCFSPAFVQQITGKGIIFLQCDEAGAVRRELLRLLSCVERFMLLPEIEQTVKQHWIAGSIRQSK